MSEPQLRYIGPLSTGAAKADPVRAWWRKIPLAFIVIVVLPTIAAMVYFLLIASPRYVSEARFIVRAPQQTQPSPLGTALQTVGLSSGTTDSYAIHEYIRSAEGLKDVMNKVDVRAMYGRQGIDIFSRLPRLFADGSFETFRQQFKQYVTVGHDAQTGISLLRVEAFAPEDAQRVAEAYLDGGEALVNRLNTRSRRDAVTEAERSVEGARQRLSAAQTKLTAFRSRERFVDPARSALAATELIGELQVNAATLKAERAQLASEAPNSPQLPLIDSRIRAYERQIAIENEKIAGRSDSLAPKISVYEDLVMEREFADKLLASATAALNTAEQDARRQQLYLERVVAPNLTDAATQPHRWTAVLSVFATCMLMYAIGWLIWSGVRESRHHL